MSGITDEMVKTSASALCNLNADLRTGLRQDTAEWLARAALEAAYSDIRKQVAEEIAEAIDEQWPGDTDDGSWPQAKRDIAIARQIGGQS